MALSTFNPYPWQCKEQCLVHIKPNWQQSWGVHADNGFYIGPALKHYRCCKVILQHTNTKRITDTILFQHDIPLPAISATDSLISAIKQLQVAITKHTVMEASNEEKAIDTLWELLTAPSTTSAHAKTTLVPETTHSSTNIAASHTATLLPPAIPQHHNLHQAHIITQDDNEVEDTPLQHHQYNLQSRAHLIADSIVPSLKSAPYLHLTNSIIHQLQPRPQSIAHTHNMCHAILDETMETPLEYRHLIKRDKYREVWVTLFAN